MIHPDATPVVAPAITLTAGRVAAPLQQLHTTSGVSLAIVPVHVVGVAGDNLVLPPAMVVAIPVVVSVVVSVMVSITVPVPAAPASFDREIGPAAMIDPDAPAIRAPTVAFAAGRLAALLHQANPAPAPISIAVMPVAIIGRAGDGANAARGGPTVLVGINGKICPAAAINPDSPTVKTPAVALVARRLAALLDEPNSAPRISATVMPAAVVRGA